MLEVYLTSVGSLILSEDEEYGGGVNEEEDSKSVENQPQTEKNAELKVIELNVVRPLFLSIKLAKEAHK